MQVLRLRYFLVTFNEQRQFIYAEKPVTTVDQLRSRIIEENNSESKGEQPTVNQMEPVFVAARKGRTNKNQRFSRKARQSTRGEEVLVLGDFLTKAGIDCFAMVSSAEAPMYSDAITMAVYRTEFPFTTSQCKRIVVVSHEDVRLSSLEATQERLCQRTRLLEQRSHGSNPPIHLLEKSLEAFVRVEKGMDGPFARFFETLDESLPLLLTQFLIMAKKALIVHEQHIAEDKADYQETLWVRFEDLKRKIGHFVPHVLEMDKLTLLSVRPVLLRGWLIKRGDKGLVRSWKKRWFAQKGKRLFYYRDDNPNRNPMGFIQLDHVRAVENRSDPMLGSYVGVHVPGRIFFLAPFSKTEEEQEFWLRGLRNWKNYLKHQRYDIEEEAEAGLLVGYLWKKGDKGKVRNSWKRRWCTQIGNKLFYYVDTKTRAKGFIDLNTLSWVHFPATNPKLKIRLHTIGETNRVWRLKCDSKDEYEYWRTGLQEYCSTAPPMNSKYFKEVQDDRVLNRKTIIEVSRSSLNNAPKAFTKVADQKIASIIDESDSSSEESDERACSKCRRSNGLCRLFCSYCGTKLVEAPKRRASVIERRSTLPPLPDNVPDKSDTLAHQAYSELKEKYRRAGVNPNAQRRHRKVKVVPAVRKEKPVTQNSSSEEEESIIWTQEAESSSDEEEIIHSLPSISLPPPSVVPKFEWMESDSYSVL